MLKIKNDVPLGRLKEFGFERKNIYYVRQFRYDVLVVHARYRFISSYSDVNINLDGSLDLFDIVFDLIKADLVEKVEE
jgi:hypothetical protein